MDRISSDDINHYYCEILRKCVKENVKCFTSSWFYGKFKGVPQSILVSMVRANLISNNGGNHTWYLKQMYSQLRYIGLCCAAKLGSDEVNPNDAGVLELSVCAVDTKLNSSVIEFLCKSTHRTTQERANVLDILKKEMELLEDFFYINLATNSIKKNVKFDFGSQNLSSIFCNAEE